MVIQQLAFVIRVGIEDFADLSPIIHYDMILVDDFEHINKTKNKSKVAKGFSKGLFEQLLTRIVFKGLFSNADSSEFPGFPKTPVGGGGGASWQTPYKYITYLGGGRW